MDLNNENKKNYAAIYHKKGLLMWRKMCVKV